MRRILTWILWILLFLAIVGVAYAAYRYLSGGGEPPAGEIVVVECSAQCADRGQCGSTIGEVEEPVVLGGSNGPVVSPQGHDIFFVAGSSVEVKNSMEVTLLDEDGREFTHPFSRVEFRNAIGDIAETGWVPEWCIRRP